ncbi:MAG: cytochrome c3 family protein [Carboxydocellales bacterium]
MLTKERLKKKIIIVFYAAVVIVVAALTYALLPALGAPVDLLGGNGSLDTTAQVGTFTRVDVTGAHTWALDTAVSGRTGAGAGRLKTPTGSNTQWDAYTYYRFTPAKLVQSSTLDLRYSKNRGSLSTSQVDNWTVTAEIWSTGGTPTLLQSITISNTKYATAFSDMPTTDITATLLGGTQYELRLRQTGKVTASGALTVWFDEVKLMATYDDTPANVLSATPITDNSIDVLFTERMDAATAEDTANYTISPALGTITSAVLQAPNYNTVRLTTSTKQTKNITYTVTVNTAVKDYAGNPMATSQSVTFSGTDTTPPTVVSASPVNGTTVDVVFNENVNVTSAQTTANYSIDNGLTVSSAVLLADNRTVRLTTSGQTSGTVYTVTVTNVKDWANVVIVGSNTAAFTGVESAPPTIVSATVVNGTTVDILFNENLNAASVQNPRNYSISPLLNVFTATLQGDNRTVRLITAQHSYNTLYTITVNKVQDAAKNNIAADSQITFTGGDTSPPVVAGAFAVDATHVDVIFNEQVESTTAQDVANYSISPSLAISAAVLQTGNKTVRLTTAGQASDTSYQLTVTNVKDTANNVISSGNKVSFNSYVTDTTQPTLIHASAGTKTVLTLRFSERVQPATSTDSANYTIGTDNGATTLNITGIISIENDFAVQITTGVQNSVKTYTITVNNVKDMANNTIAANSNITVKGFSPHGLYLSDTEYCAVCHLTHGALGPKLLAQPTVTILCYLCHDTGGQSDYNVVGTEFNRVSHHPVTEEIINCISCHNPHGNEQSAGVLYPKLLRSTDGANNTYYSGNGFCLACHGSYDRGFTGTYYANTAGNHTNANAAHYDTAKAVLLPASGTKVTCSKCHEQHGSQNNNLIDNALLLDSAKGGQELCLTCHNNGANAMSGRNIEQEYARTGSTHDLAPGSGSDAGTVEGCTSCHGPHTAGAATFAAGLAYSDISDPDNTKEPWTTAKGDLVDWCLKCHDGTPPIASLGTDNLVPYTVVFPPKNITINASGYNKTLFKKSTHFTGVAMKCDGCHQEHGSDSYNLWRYGEDTTTVDGICLRCHKSGVTVNGKTPQDIKTELQKGVAAEKNSYRHPVLDKDAGVQHFNTENYQNRPLADRHAECTDCHDPHYEIPTEAGTKAPSPPGAVINISGVAPVMDAGGLVDASNNPITWENYKTSDKDGNIIGSLIPQFTWKRPIQKQYEICLKCHSYYSYETNTPVPSGSRRQTDPVKEFNPRNESYHGVMAAPKTTASGKYVGTDRFGNTWTKDSRLYCEDCHGTDNSTGRPYGPHGSAVKYILKRPYTPSTDTEGLTGTGSTAATDNDLCFMCHDRNTYGKGTSSLNASLTGFSSGSDNLHNRGHDGRSCNSCHSMVIHGSRLPHLLVGKNIDPYPYNNNSWFRPDIINRNGTDDYLDGYTVQEISNSIKGKSRNWSQNDCDHSVCG